MGLFAERSEGCAEWDEQASTVPSARRRRGERAVEGGEVRGERAGIDHGPTMAQNLVGGNDSLEGRGVTEFRRAKCEPSKSRDPWDRHPGRVLVESPRRRPFPE